MSSTSRGPRWDTAEENEFFDDFALLRIALNVAWFSGNLLRLISA